jgi:phosphatidylethanolamine/phosphatidyl-N-methylethanolamine N-methyltransferase
LRRVLEKWFSPAARKLGRTEFSWQSYKDWADSIDGMRLTERRAMPPFGHFALIRFAKAGESSAKGADRSLISTAV